MTRIIYEISIPKIIEMGNIIERYRGYTLDLVIKNGKLYSLVWCYIKFRLILISQLVNKSKYRNQLIG